MSVTSCFDRENRRKLLYAACMFAVLAFITAGVFASNGWFPRTDAFSGKRYGWFGKEIAKNAPSAWNPLPSPTPTPSPTPYQLSKEYVYAGQRLLTVEDKNATAVPPADLGIWRPTSGIWYVRIDAENWTTYTWGESGDEPVVGDYDGDGTTDFSVWRSTDQKWYVVLSSTGGFYNYQFGNSTDLPAPADYDGDGKTDEAVYRDGTWYIHASSVGYYTDSSVTYASGDLPAAADYDGDGKADLAVFRPSDRKFYAKLSGDNSTPTIWPNFNPSSPDWEPVSGDYDGDGKADYAVYDKNSGYWYVRSSAGGSYASPISWGQSGDKVVHNDYDADGKIDYAIWRPSNGTWYIQKSGDSYSWWIVQWGQSGDTPVPAFFRR